MSKRMDIFIGIGILIAVSILFWDSLDIPASRFEPMGSAALPQGILLAMGILSIIEIVQAMRGQNQSKHCEHELIVEAQNRNLPVYDPQFSRQVKIKTIITLLIFISYITVLTFELINYYLATFIFASLLTAYLSFFKKKYTIIGILVISIILGLLFFMSKAMSVFLPST